MSRIEILSESEQPGKARKRAMKNATNLQFIFIFSMCRPCHVQARQRRVGTQSDAHNDLIGRVYFASAVFDCQRDTRYGSHDLNYNVKKSKNERGAICFPKFLFIQPFSGGFVTTTRYRKTCSGMHRIRDLQRCTPGRPWWKRYGRKHATFPRSQCRSVRR